jgi:O-antigen/teichoic acid export membrane protein
MQWRQGRPENEQRRRIPRSAKGLSLRVGLTGIDQCVSSLGNFAVGVAVARVAGAAGLGEYSLTYVTWLIVAALHRSLVTDPMAIENDVSQPDAPAHLRLGLAAEFTLGITSAVCFAATGLVLLAVGQHGFGVAFLAFAPWLPFLVAQDYFRWVAFMEARPAKALSNDIVFDAVQVVAFVALFFAGYRSAGLAITAWGVGAGVGTLYGLRQFSVRASLRGGVSRIRLRWGISKWLMANSAANTVSQQVVTVLAAAILGPVGIGGLRAANALVIGPSQVLIQAGGSIGLPEAVRALHQKGWDGLRRVQRFITLASFLSVAPITVGVLLFAKQLLSGIYGHQFGRFATVADVLVLAFLLGTLRLGPALALKATRQTRILYRISLAYVVASLGLTAILTPLFGVLGAAEAMMGENVVFVAATLFFHWQRSRPEAERIYRDLQAGSETVAPSGAELDVLVDARPPGAALANGGSPPRDESGLAADGSETDLGPLRTGGPW